VGGASQSERLAGLRRYQRYLRVFRSTPQYGAGIIIMTDDKRYLRKTGMNPDVPDTQ
jgi:hypothetical protein